VTVTLEAGPIGSISNFVSVSGNEGDMHDADNTHALSTIVVARPQCGGRPPVQVKVTATGDDSLHVVVTPPSIGQGSSGQELNRIGAIYFRDHPLPPGHPNGPTQPAIQNARVAIVGGPSGLSGAIDIPLRRPEKIEFDVLRQQSSYASTILLTVVDDCGPWDTVAGWGTNRWGNNNQPEVVSSTTSANSGTYLTYTMSVRNIGELGADGVTLVNTIPDGAVPISSSASQGSCMGVRPILCNFGRLEKNATASVSVVVQGYGSGPVYNSAYVVSSAYDRRDVDNHVTSMTTLIPPPAPLPGSRALTDAGGNPASMPGSRALTGASGNPQSMPGSR
jgi:uncharacterized repeat protein (TIGR01451 family)